MWRKICIGNIEVILMMPIKNILKNEAVQRFPRIKPQISRFILSELDLHIFAPKFQIKIHKDCKTVHSSYAC
jgi:hypothetical protein